jgi:hypothetical protein
VSKEKDSFEQLINGPAEPQQSEENLYNYQPKHAKRSKPASSDGVWMLIQLATLFTGFGLLVLIAIFG